MLTGSSDNWAEEDGERTIGASIFTHIILWIPGKNLGVKRAIGRDSPILLELLVEHLEGQVGDEPSVAFIRRIFEME